MSLLSCLIVPINIINNIVVKCKSLLPGAGSSQKAEIVIAEGSLKEYMKSSKFIQEAALKYPKKNISFIIDMMIIIFFCQFFGKMMKQFLEDINQGILLYLMFKATFAKTYLFSESVRI